MAFGKFRCLNISLDALDYVNLRSFYRFQIKRIVEEISFNLLSLPFSKIVIKCWPDSSCRITLTRIMIVKKIVPSYYFDGDIDRMKL